MKTKKFLLLSLLLAGTSFSLASCGGKATISIWVGKESVDFYTNECKAFLEANPDFGYNLDIIGADTGTTGGAMVTDNSACADIVTVAHDNIGKCAEKGLALPITDVSLLDQIKNDNPESFSSVIQSKFSGETELDYFGSPYISQALMLFYNKSVVKNPVDAQSFEGLKQVAQTSSSGTKQVKATTITGVDGYNYSFNLLAVNNETKESKVKIYENLDKKNCYAQDDETVANLRWAQRFFNDPYGGLLPTDSSWETSVKNGDVLSVIGGAWHFNAFSTAIGIENTGVTLIPTYTLTSEDVEGTTCEPNLVMRGGTFADCKCFMMNSAAATDKIDSMQTIIKYLSSKEVQLRSFIEVQNIPSFKTAAEEIEQLKDSLDETTYALAKAQIGMAEYGRPQPFVTGTLNTYYYSKKAPDYYKNAVANVNGEFDDVNKLRETLYVMQHIWQKGKEPDVLPSSYPSTI